jgi:putative transposase
VPFWLKKAEEEKMGGLREDLRLEVVRGVLSCKITKAVAGEKLDVGRRSVNRYLKRFLERGPEGLRDRRRSNYRKLTVEDEHRVVFCNLKGPHRSARFVRDKLKLRVHEQTVWRVFVGHRLNRVTLPPVKPIQRFEAEKPNDLWQIDVQGKINFPKIGVLYLITVIDDHSRFILAGAWFRKQNKINVFSVWYRALCQHGIPQRILSDKGTQFRSAHRVGEADFEYYSKVLGIRVIHHKKSNPKCKGKIERFFEFIQRDFVLENLVLDTVEKVNIAFWKWINQYNHKHRSRALQRKTPKSRYRPPDNRKSPKELEYLICHEEPRRFIERGTSLTMVTCIEFLVNTLKPGFRSNSKVIPSLSNAAKKP